MSVKQKEVDSDGQKTFVLKANDKMNSWLLQLNVTKRMNYENKQ